MNFIGVLEIWKSLGVFKFFKISIYPSIVPKMIFTPLKFWTTYNILRFVIVFLLNDEFLNWSWYINNLTFMLSVNNNFVISIKEKIVINQKKKKTIFTHISR